MSQPAKKVEPAEASAAAVDQKPFAALLRDRWCARESGVRFNEHEVVPEAGTPFEHLLRQEYWANIAAKLRPGDNIIAFAEDGAWRAELIVWQVGQAWARVSGEAVARPDFGAAPKAAEELFEISYTPHKKHRVIRIADRIELKSGFDTPEEARRWLLDYQRALTK